MKIDIIKTNDDGTVVIKKEQLESAQTEFSSLQTKATEQFNLGYAKGAEKSETEGVKNLLSKLDFLDLDKSNLDQSLADAKKKVNDLKAGTAQSGDLVKELQNKLEKATTANEKLQTDFSTYKKSTKIDDTLKTLAAQHVAVNPAQIPILFKSEFQVDLDNNDNVVVKNSQGIPILDDKGQNKTIQDIFEASFKTGNPHLFKASDKGGSGGGGQNIPADVSYKDIKGDDAKKAQYIHEHGLEAYQKLVANG